MSNTNSFTITGKLIKRGEVEQVTDSFTRREFVIEVQDGQYPQFVKFQCVQDRTAIVSGFKKDDQIKVHFDLRGREWNGKYFTNLNAWRVEATTGPPPAPEPTTKPEPANTGTVEDDELPF